MKFFKAFEILKPGFFTTTNFRLFLNHRLSVFLISRWCESFPTISTFSIIIWWKPCMILWRLMGIVHPDNMIWAGPVHFCFFWLPSEITHQNISVTSYFQTFEQEQHQLSSAKAFQRPEKSNPTVSFRKCESVFSYHVPFFAGLSMTISWEVFLIGYLPPWKPLPPCEYYSENIIICSSKSLPLCG